MYGIVKQIYLIAVHKIWPETYEVFKTS
jgi:hypothetical protein